MRDLVLIFIEEEDSLLDLNNIKIVLVSNKGKIEIGMFISIFNKLIGLDLIDFTISNSLNSIVHIKQTQDLKEYNIKDKNVYDFDHMIQLLINIYSDYYNLNKIYYIASNDDLFSKLRMKDINYKKINESLYDTIFDLKED